MTQEQLTLILEKQEEIKEIVLTCFFVLTMFMGISGLLFSKLK